MNNQGAGPETSPHYTRRKAMKKFIVMAMVLVICLVGSVHNSQSMDVDAASKIILDLTREGMIYGDQNATDMFIYVEPLFWKKLTHVQKMNLVKAGMEISKGIKEGVIVCDMTSKSTVATGSIDTGRIKIYK